MRHICGPLPGFLSTVLRILPGFCGICLICLVGCGGSAPLIPVPAVAVDEAVEKAFAKYDQNKDDFLDAQELERCPSLRKSLKALDKSGSGKISREALAERLKMYQSTAISLMPVPFEVLQDGQPLDGATVTLVPEEFMGPHLKPASGVSDRSGRVQLKVEGLEGTGSYCGFFRIQVSKKNAAGQETLPARYNSATTLGQEIAPGMREGVRLRLD